MVMFTKAVANGRQNALIVADLPNKSYENEADAVSNSERLINAGADAVKLEGRLPDIIKAIIKAGIPVMGHLGLLPQTATKYTVQGKTKEDAQVLLEDAKALQEAGCFSIVFEMVVADTMKKITEVVSVPTIGIGCGKDCDGQVLVIHDMLGLFEKLQPKFVKRYLSLSEQIRKAVAQYVKDVEDVTFPADEHSFYSVPERPQGWFWWGIESGFKCCCIFFYIYCRSIWSEQALLDHDRSLREHPEDWQFVVHQEAQTSDKKLQEETDRSIMEYERKKWFEGQGDCWILEPGYVRCPDCIAKELKRRKKTNTLNQFRDVSNYIRRTPSDNCNAFLKEQK
jgi:3-methyl-2-oxobutanoate hydroxymethyltransferase